MWKAKDLGDLIDVTGVQVDRRAAPVKAKSLRREFPKAFGWGFQQVLRVLTGLAPGPSLIAVDRSFVTQNARELERLRGLLARLSDEDLGAMVNEYWTVAGVLGHMTFWDGRALFLAGKLERGQPSTASDGEPENVDWINDATRPLIHAIPPREAAELALRVAEETDRAVASLSPELVATIDASTPLNPLRADHRGEHLDEIEAALSARTKR